MKYIKYLLPFSVLLFVVNTILSIYSYNTNTCVLNKGVAFGIGIEYIYPLTIALLLLLVFLGCKIKKPYNYFFYTLAILGSSNLLSRFLLNGICDYIHLFNLSFNIADISIVSVGAVGIWYILFQRE